jgi:hypothetical protein
MERPKMKIASLCLALAGLCVPVSVAAQGSQGVGVLNKPLSPTAFQMGGVDPTGKLKAVKVDEDGNLLSAADKQENVTLAAANVASAAATIFGGSYVFSQSCASYNGGALALRYRGPDGTTMVTLLTRTASDSTGGAQLALGSNSVLDVTLPAGSTGCNATLSRVP